MTDITAKLAEALERIADPRNTHFAGDARVVAAEAMSAYRQHTEAQAGGTEGERAAFEAAMAAEGYEISQTRYRDGTYRSQEYAAGWAMWRTRAALASAPAAAQGDFWQWLAKTYRHQAESDGVHFTRWNMQVAHEAGRQQGMEQERALWQMAKDALESGMYDDALCAPAKAEMAKAEQAVPVEGVVWEDGGATLVQRGSEHERRGAKRLYLAPQPATERRPLTESELRAEFKRLQQDCEERLVMDLPDFIAGAEFAQRHFGITAGTAEQAKEHGNG